MKENRIYWKVLGMGEYLLGYTSCKKTYLKECIKEGWAENQLTFIEKQAKVKQYYDDEQ